MSELSASERYLAQVKKAEIVDVQVPSGFVFKFEKPPKFRMLFEYGQVPQSAASGAVQSWIDQGVIKPGDIPDDTATQINEGIKLRDRVLALSQHPTKLVVGDPGEGEIDARLLSDEDATYLFAWVQAGGDTSLMLANFPKGPKPGAVAGNGGAKRRKARK